MSAFEVPVGAGRWSFEVPAARLQTVPSRTMPEEPIANPRAAIRGAMEHPLRFGHPLRRAMTPDDRVALVIDEHLPHLGEMVAGVLEYLASAGIGSDMVTILTPSGGGSSDWIEELPDEFADVRTEAHQHGDRKQLSYLATSKAGRRIYMNRTLVDADQIVSISGRRYDPLLGYAGGEASLYPLFSDHDTRRAMSVRLTMKAATSAVTEVRAEAAEIAWLLGSPIFIQVIEGSGDDIAGICAGLSDTSGDGVKLLDERWRYTIPAPADVVVTGLAGRSARHDFATLARAVTAMSRAVKPDGIIIVLSEAEPQFGEGMELLRQCDDYTTALNLLGEVKPVDLPTAFQWVSAASHTRIYLASGLKPEWVEEIFATPILSPGEVQRLLDQGGSCLVLPDADKCQVVIEG